MTLNSINPRNEEELAITECCQVDYLKPLSSEAKILRKILKPFFFVCKKRFLLLLRNVRFLLFNRSVACF
jgi:hypothetical protein